MACRCLLSRILNYHSAPNTILTLTCQRRLQVALLEGTRKYSAAKSTTSDGPDTYFITTPIFYVNSVPHIGHLHTTVLSDCLARWHRIKGKHVIFSTGTDEHGMKIQKAALDHNQQPADYCDKISAEFQRLFTLTNISHTNFIRTTEQRHIETVQHFWQRIYDNGYIYKGSYSGWYCTSDEAFLTDDRVDEITSKDGKLIKVSADSGHPVEWMEEENYMFKLSAFKQQLLDWLRKDVIKPAKFQAVVNQWVEQSLQDLSVSRTTKRLTWGIPVPGDPTQTIYVWLDALVNYLTVGGYPRMGYTWPAQCHVVGKDILKFHAVYWPAFLMAADLPVPDEIMCHSHWLVDGVKMSKSLGNVVNPFDDVNKYTVDGLRYFLLREAVPHSDANYTTDKVTNILNSELANTLGNLLGRCTSMAVNPNQHFPEFDEELFKSTSSDADQEMMKSLHKLPGFVDDCYTEYNIYKGIDAVMNQLRLTNTFLEQQKPWELCKHNERARQLGNVLHLTMETLRVCAILLQPITPDMACRILDALNIPKDSRMFVDSKCHFQGGTSLAATRSGPAFKRITHRSKASV
ncbi:hypothetical protein LSH36_748g02067 [Paralvinella palmiformis]|uniref:Methionine--tRNA ligase, mitochondrial n=1 Tax=Paralvinella palmiformis TaxID=53620 RepID=A0AAD9J0Y5_9ANNE|nr:hypothetical protein LSH36_748g02067 [Paralvinella palmiformis]